jgi:hypothetical protein
VSRRAATVPSGGAPLGRSAGNINSNTSPIPVATCGFGRAKRAAVFRQGSGGAAASPKRPHPVPPEQQLLAARMAPSLAPSEVVAAAAVHGAEKVKKAKRAKPTLEAVSEHAGQSKLVRALGSTDYVTREKGLQALTRWLQRKSEMSEADMLKVWKGLFYCFWHSDKAPVQVRAGRTGRRF